MFKRVERSAERLPTPLRQPSLLVVRTVRSTIDDRVYGLAAEVAFFAILALPPLLLAIVGSIGYFAELLGATARTEIEAFLTSIPAAFLAPDTARFVNGLIVDVLAEGRLDVVSIGFLVALWGGSRAVNVYLVALPLVYNIGDPRPAWRRRALAYALTLSGALVLAVIVPALVVGPDAIVALLAMLPGPMDDAAARMIALAFWPVVGLLTVLLITVLYDVGVPWDTPLWRDLPGAFLAMGIWILGGVGLRLFAEIAIRGDDIYGPLATPLVILLWAYLTAFAVLLGAELNAEIEQMWPHADEGEEEEGSAP